MITKTELIFLLQLSNIHASGITGSQNLVVSRAREANRVSRISVFLCWLAYLTTMQSFPQAGLAHSSREINHITRGSDPLRGLNFKNCESEPYINDSILRIPLLL